MDNSDKLVFTVLVLILVCMFATITTQESYNRDIVVACYESGKLDCEKLNK